MKKLAAICLFVLMLSTFGYAEFAILKIEGRVKNSDLIVIGKLVNVSETETENHRISKGALVIEKVIYGNFVKSNGQRLKLEDKVEVEWWNSKMIACQFGFAENEKQIWFLTVDSEGKIESLSPSTTASLDEQPEINKHLKKLKRSDKKAKIIKIQDDSQQNPLAETPVGNDPAISFGVYSLERKMNYQPILVFLVILGSISLYYLLYRSRFKIR
jgi:hypothetical protein